VAAAAVNLAQPPLAVDVVTILGYVAVAGSQEQYVPLRGVLFYIMVKFRF